MGKKSEPCPEKTKTSRPWTVALVHGAVQSWSKRMMRCCRELEALLQDLVLRHNRECNWLAGHLSRYGQGVGDYPRRACSSTLGATSGVIDIEGTRGVVAKRRADY